MLLVGANPRTEAPLLNTRLRKAWLAGNTEIMLIGEQADLTYDYNWLGAGSKTLSKLPKAALDLLNKAERPAIIVGGGALGGEGGAAVLHALGALAKKTGVVTDGWNGFNVLHHAAARVGGLDLGFVPGEGGLTATQMAGKSGLDLLFLLGADEIDTAKSRAFMVYLGSHGDAGAHSADVILPGAAYTEKAGTVRQYRGPGADGRTGRLPAKGHAKEDWAVLRALSERVGKTLPYDTLDQLRTVLMRDHPQLRPYRLSGAGGGVRRWRAWAGRATWATWCSVRSSPISISPIRSRGPARPWPNCPPCGWPRPR